MIISSVSPKRNIGLKCLWRKENDSLKEQRVFNEYGFISPDNVLRAYLGKVLIYDLQTHPCIEFCWFFNQFFSSKSTEYLHLDRARYLKGLHENIVKQISGDSPYPEMFSNESNLCVKSVQIWSYYWSVFSCILTEYRKIRTRNNSLFGHFSRSESWFWIFRFELQRR